MIFHPSTYPDCSGDISRGQQFQMGCYDFVDNIAESYWSEFVQSYRMLFFRYECNKGSI